MAGNPKDVARDSHDKKIEEALEKARGLGKTEGYEWVVSTKYRLLEDYSKEVTSENIKENIIKIGVFKTEPARVVVQKGLTMNLGNYESARVTVGLEVPCYVEEVQQIEQVSNEIVEKRIQQEVVEVRGKDIRPGYEAQRQGAAAGAPATSTKP